MEEERELFAKALLDYRLVLNDTIYFLEGCRVLHIWWCESRSADNDIVTSSAIKSLHQYMRIIGKARPHYYTFKVKED